MLEGFGLNQNEALIYTYLLERGTEVGGSKIAQGTGLHRQYVYLGMQKLIELGLAEAVAHGKQKRYKATPPLQIERIARRRMIDAENLVRELNTFSTLGHEQDFEVFVGDRAIQQYEVGWIEGLKEHTEQYIIGGNTQGFVEMMGEELNDYLIGESRKKVTTYYLGHTSEKHLWSDVSILAKNDLHAKFIDRLPRGVTHFVVREDTIAFFSFLKPPLLYVIKSPVVAQNYKDFFMMLWEMAQ